jgi:hypothetical protein
MTSSEPTGGEARVRTPVHLWIVGVLALLWNFMGAFDYVAVQFRLDFYMSQYTQEQIIYVDAFPAWAVAGWALAVWAALFGSVGLLLRQSWSAWAFVIALAGLAVSSLYTLGLSDGIEIMGTGALIFSAVIWVVSILLIVYARAQAKAGVLT